MLDKKAAHKGALRPYLSPFGAWAMALGASIGWGSMVVTSSSYLLQAGPWGSVLGLALGALIMIAVARNYHYMANCFPDAGGAYTYAKEVHGHDLGFLTAWFLSLTYLAILWANATSIPLFMRFFVGDVFKCGFSYTVFGYTVYGGEVLLTVAVIVACCVLCLLSRKVAMRLVVGLCILFSAGIAICFFGALLGFDGAPFSMDPAFLPDASELAQVLFITTISSWAFIGFESISNSAEEFDFPRTRLFRILVLAVVTATVLYAFVFLLSTMAYPDGYASWLEYISDLGNLQGLESLPVFFAARYYLGDAGVVMLMLALLGLVVTSLVTLSIAASRLFNALGRDSVLPHRFAATTFGGVPRNALLLVMVVSLLVPFLGRTAIGWIVDVTTIGATFTYGVVSACALKVARARGDTVERTTGAVGVVLMLAFGAYLVLSGLADAHTLEPESYFLFAAWGILGFIYFRMLLNRDGTHRYGRSMVVWIALLSLVMFVTFTWMSESLQSTFDGLRSGIASYFGQGAATAQQLADGQFVDQQLALVNDSNSLVIIVAAVLFIMAAALLLSSFSYMSKWALANEKELNLTRDVLYTDPLTGLSSMSRFENEADALVQTIVDEGHRPCVSALDFAGMKDFNARYGRDKGDKLLQSLAQALQRQFGDDACARVNDDRFCVVAREEGLEGRLQELFDAFEDERGEATLPIRAGVSAFEPAEGIAAGYERARAASARDKRAWQSHVSWFHETMSDEARLRMHVLGYVDQAIANDWVRPYYQAIFSAKTGEVAVEEALARWIDPELGFMSPGVFIPILEEAGLLYKVDLHIVDCVLRDMQTKREAGMPVVPVSVNISLRDLGQIDISREILDRMDAAGISPDLLKVEFTESVASEDPTTLHSALDALHAADVDVWMDDFGSGYSSLNSLKNSDFDLVKLDMDFLRNERGERTWDIIGGVVGIVRTIGMRSLVEGVETEQQVERLKEVGCDLLQGFYFARPQPLDEIVAAFKDGSGPVRSRTVFPSERPAR